ncbi:hypothetical protein HD806DRAFT_468546 [Xylariaceae sp. AK1471]|nr:hypothetical protein HD806DRAFT_468546 [Xylariaceae sp. AK1471]
MQLYIYYSFAIFQVFLTAASNALPQDGGGTTTCFPTMWVSDASSTTTATEPTVSPMKTLSLCCCCLARPPYTFDEPQPSPDHYMGECSKPGVRDVCGDEYTGISGFVLEGLEGQPDRIAAECSVSRCGAMLFVD